MTKRTGDGALSGRSRALNTTEAWHRFSEDVNTHVAVRSYARRMVMALKQLGNGKRPAADILDALDTVTGDRLRSLEHLYVIEEVFAMQRGQPRLTDEQERAIWDGCTMVLKDGLPKHKQVRAVELYLAQQSVPPVSRVTIAARIAEFSAGKI